MQKMIAIAPIIAAQIGRVPEHGALAEIRDLAAGLTDVLHIVETDGHNKEHEMEDCTAIAMAWSETTTLTGRCVSPLVRFISMNWPNPNY